MAKEHGIAGEWARVRGTVLSLWPLFLSFVFLGAFLSALILGAAVWLFSSLLLASMIAVVAYWRKGLRRVESFFRGARGEERVARILAGLPDEWHVFHDFVAGPNHVDHVVVSPAGVFSVETKNWFGKVEVVEGHILVNGALPTREPIGQSRREADRVAEVLEKTGYTGVVSPVVCFASDTFCGEPMKMGTVTVLNSVDIKSWFASLPEVVSANELGRLVSLMESGK